MRIENILFEGPYCPPLTTATFADAFAAAANGRGGEERLDYATNANHYATFRPTADGGVEITVWGYDLSQPDADPRTTKFERRSIFEPDDEEEARQWTADQAETALREGRKEGPWARGGRKAQVAVHKLRYNEPLDRARRAKRANLKFVSEKNGNDKQRGKYRSFRFQAGEHEKTYDLEVRLFGDKINGDSHAWVNCGCGDHRYKWEWALATRGSAALIHALDKKPLIRNPKLLKATCKHVHAALEWLRWNRGA